MNRKQEIRRFNTLLSKISVLAHIDREETKRTMIHDVTRGRTLHTDEVTDNELCMMTSFLQNKVNDYSVKKSGERMRKKILHYCHLMQWYTPVGKLNWERIDAFCTRSGHKHKPLKLYTAEELPTLVSQFEEVYKSYLNKF